MQNDQNTYWFEVGKILDMQEDGDVSIFVSDNISYSEEFQYTREQSRFAINALSKLYNVINKVCQYDTRGASGGEKYYIQKIKPFFVNQKIYYEVTFTPANDYASKSNRIIAFCCPSSMAVTPSDPLRLIFLLCTDFFSW